MLIKNIQMAKQWTRKKVTSNPEPPPRNSQCKHLVKISFYINTDEE